MQKQIDLGPRPPRKGRPTADELKRRAAANSKAAAKAKVGRMAVERGLFLSEMGPIPRGSAEGVGSDLVRAVLSTSDRYGLYQEAEYNRNYWAMADRQYAGWPNGSLHLRLEDLEAIALATQYGGTAGTDSVGTSASRTTVIFPRKSVPDPLDLLPMVQRVPGAFGESSLAILDVPDAVLAGEAGDGGYAVSGDGYTSGLVLTPHPVVLHLKITRVAEHSQKGLIAAILLQGLAKLKEKIEAQIVFGDGVGDNLLGLYFDTAIPNSVNLSSIGSLTADVARAGLTGPTLGRNPRLLLAREAQIALRSVTGGMTGVVEPLMSADGRIDNIPSLRTAYLAGDGTKTARALAVALGECYYKIWSDTIEATAYYQNGSYDVELVAFVDYALPVKSYCYRFLQA